MSQCISSLSLSIVGALDVREQRTAGLDEMKVKDGDDDGKRREERG